MALGLSLKHHLLAFVSELAGTFLFLFFAYGGTNAVNSPASTKDANLAADPARLLFISLAFGISLAVNAWVFYRVSGGLFNPAVTLGMVLTGNASILRGAIMMLGQVLGGIAAAGAVSAVFPGPLGVATTLVSGTSVVRGLFIEVITTAELVFTIFMLAGEKHRATFVAPIGIGLSLFIIEMTAVYWTGGSVNPARSFGPCVVNHSFPGYHWIYWVGPFLGSAVASGFYLFLKAFNYQTLNPDQDSDGLAVSRLDSVSTHVEKSHAPGGIPASAPYERGPNLEAAH